MKSLMRISFLLAVGFMITCPAMAGDDRPITCKQGNYFIQNVGQLDDPSILYYSDITSGRLYIRQNDIVFQLNEPRSSEERNEIARFSPENRFRNNQPYPEREEPCPRKISNVYVTFSGSNLTEIIPEDEQVTKINIFKGNDPNKWHTDIPTFGAVRIRNLYENVDLVIGGDRNDPEAPIWHLEGDANRFEDMKMSVDTNLPARKVDIPLPGELKTVHEKMAESQPQTQGQQLLWGTYLGGGTNECPKALSIDSQTSEIVVAGYTDSTDIPVPNGYDQTFNSGWDEYDIYLAKIASSGDSLLWGTYIGGSVTDVAQAIAIDISGNIWLAGETQSSDIPVPNGFCQNYGGAGDIYLAKLSSSGDSLFWGTYVGGTGTDWAYSLAFDSSDNVVFAGDTYSSDIPVPNGYDQTYNNQADMYLAKLSSAGDSLLWGTYIGGSYDDNLTAIAVDSSQNIILAGYSDSSNIPTPNGYNQTLGGGDDIYLAKISSGGDALIWGTYIGGTGMEEAFALCLDSSGSVVIVGRTCSTDIPVPNGYDQTFNGNQYDIYLAKLSADGNSTLWGTYIGGSGVEEAIALSLDSSDNVLIAGATDSSDIPVPLGYDQTYNDPFPRSDIYVAKLGSSGNNLLWGTYIGGTWGEEAFGLSLDSSSNVVIIGCTSSIDIPVPNGYDETFSSLSQYDSDMYVAKLTQPVPCPDIVLSPETLPSGTAGTDYSQTISAWGGTAPYTYSVTAGNLPFGLFLNSVTGLLWGKPIEIGAYEFTIAATDNGMCSGTRAYHFTVDENSCPAIYLSPVSLPSGSVGCHFSQTISASGGMPPYSFSVSSGAVPSGLMLSAEGVLSGTPMVAGTYNFGIRAADANSCADSQSYSLIVSPVSCPTIVLSRSHFPNGRVDDGYSVDITASGGSSPYLFALTGGSLPPGLDLSSGGWIQGTPSAEGLFDFVITATDIKGCSGTQTCSMQITPAVPPPIITSVIKKTDPFRLKLRGSNFHPDVVILLNNGQIYPWNNISYKNTHLIVLNGGPALKAQFPKGVPVAITVVNGDGGSATITYTR